MNVDDLRAHVDRLAVDAGVRLVLSGRRAHAHARARYRLPHRPCPTCGPLSPGDLVACIHPIRGVHTYIVALHELGHLLSDRQHPDQYVRLEREVDATWWAWLHSRVHNDAARAAFDHLSIGYLEQRPMWTRPATHSRAWAQIADLSRQPTKHDHRKALTCTRPRPQPSTTPSLPGSASPT